VNTPGASETRLYQLEGRFEYLLNWLQDLARQLRLAQQVARNAGSDYPQVTGGSSTVGCYYCQPGSTVAAATGTWPTITPTGFIADVYQASGATQTLLAAGAQIYNYMPKPLTASLTCFLSPDNAGNYNTVTQVCP
jgi:hypothetical protein